MTLFTECDACKLAREIVPGSSLCSGCRHNSAVIDTCTRGIANLENVIAALTALLAHAVETQQEDSRSIASQIRLRKILADLNELQGHTHNTGLTDQVQAIIESIDA